MKQFRKRMVDLSTSKHQLNQGYRIYTHIDFFFTVSRTGIK